jgi:hypothetical protein
MTKLRLIGEKPKTGIQPIIDGRCGGIRLQSLPKLWNSI